MKTIHDILKNYDVKLSCGNKWLVMDGLGNDWVFIVYEHKYGAKHITELFRGSDEEESIRFLTQ
jgi:hypothetical protein